MVTPIQQQRGAVTLIGALFLIFVIIVMLSAVQRMAATEITDTALQNDGVEALFLAESGLERAAWRYATGSSCAALAGESALAGRGSFDVLSAALVGSLCRVRVQGSVITTVAANTVVRRVDADFNKSATSTGWATGKKDGGSANLNYWDGSSWSVSPAAAVPAQELNGIYCMADNDCWTVGKKNGGAANINHWDGSSWSISAAAALPAEDLTSIHCVSASDCWTVGKKNGGSANINHWDGSSWSISAAAALPAQDLTSIHCVSASACWTVGKKNGGSANINHWNGSSWSISAAAAVPAQDLTSIHCVSTSDCWTVGNKNGGSANINHWNGSSWSASSAAACT